MSKCKNGRNYQNPKSKTVELLKTQEQLTNYLKLKSKTVGTAENSKAKGAGTTTNSNQKYREPLELKKQKSWELILTHNA